MTTIRSMAVALVCLAGMSAQAEPHRPADGDAVLVVLPEAGNPALRALRRERAALDANPGDLDIALSLARRHYELARETGDMRHAGQARSALAFWWDRPTPPIPVLLMRAALRQHAHEFDLALLDLAEVLRRAPDHPQALLSSAMIHSTRGETDKARAACAGLEGSVAELVSEACLGAAARIDDSDAGARDRLERALALAHGPAPATRAWALTVLAELSGDDLAEAHYLEALRLTPQNLYAQAAYADLLLREGRAEEALAVIEGETSSLPLILRRALALKALGRDEAGLWARRVEAELAIERWRDEEVHLREAARFALDWQGDAEAALALARENWAQQREPADRRLLQRARDAAREHARGGKAS